MLKNISLLSLLSITFICGLSAGTYNIFSFNEINTENDFILSQDKKKPFETPSYLHKTSFYKLHSQNNYDVVFIGDSLTDGSDWYDIFPNKKIANRGIGSDTTEGVLNRMDTIVNTNAKKAFLMIGVNDIGRNIDMNIIFDNYVKIIIELQKNNITPLIQSILLTNTVEIDNADVNNLNSRLKSFCEKNDIVFIDLNTKLSLNGKLNESYSSDGIHLNGQGYVLWSDTILKYVK